LAILGVEYYAKMEVMMKLLEMACLVMLAAFLPSQAHAKEVRVPSGTIVVVKTLRAISSETAKADEIVDLQVAADVLVGGIRVIVVGAPVTGAIEELESAEMLGQEGRVAISINSAQAVDGTNVPLTGRISSRGDEEMTGTVVGAIFCPLFLLNQGGEAAIALGAQGRGIVIGEVIIDVPTS
jgi:hypothetical protein